MSEYSETSSDGEERIEKKRGRENEVLRFINCVTTINCTNELLYYI